MRVFNHGVGRHFAVAMTVLGFAVLTAPSQAATAKAQGMIALPTPHLENTLLNATDLPAQQQGIALRFVETTGLGKNLSLLLLDEVKRSPSVTAAIKEYGFDTVKQMVVYAIKDVQSAHAPAWNSMLAGVYEDYFDTSEMTSIMQKKERSPYFTKMLDRQSDIASAVAGEGQAIFTQAQTDVMQKLHTAFTH